MVFAQKAAHNLLIQS